MGRSHLLHRAERDTLCSGEAVTPTFELLKLWFSDPELKRQFFGNFEIQDNGCHLWLGPFWERGHGRYVFDGENTRTHRLRWIWSRQNDIPEGIYIRHLLCNNKRCGNPAHLVGGSWRDNAEDEQFIHGRPMAFGPGHITGGEPGTR
jgi:hypothetical protein